MTGAAAGYAAPNAVSGETNPPWASSTADEWLANGWLHGYADGTIRLGKTVSRAEFLAFVNRAFGIADPDPDPDPSPVNFPDIEQDAWYYGEFAKAVNAGYADSPDGMMRPAQAVNRGEAALMIAKLLRLDLADDDASAFADGAAISAAERGAVAALFKKGILKGFPDGSFRPAEPITRASAMVMIQAARQTGIVGNRNYDAAGTYGPDAGTETIYGNVTVSDSGVSLRNLVIHGHLIIAGGTGEGDVVCDNVQVPGQTILRGGGSYGVRFQDSALGELVIDQPAGTADLAAEGTTSIKQITARSPAALVLGEHTSVGHLVLDAPATVSGKGSIGRATLRDGSEHSSFEAEPAVVDGSRSGSIIVTAPAPAG